MAKRIVKKSSTETTAPAAEVTATEVAVAPKVEETPAPQAAEAPKAKRTSRKKVVAAEETAQAVETVPVVAEVTTAPVAEAPKEEAPATSTADEESDSKKRKTRRPKQEFSEVIEQAISSVKANQEAMKAILLMLQEAQKAYTRQVRASQKEAEKSKNKRKSDTPRKEAGFNKPALLSDQLADYLHNVAGYADVARGTCLKRTKVTSLLRQHFRQAGMLKEGDGRFILYEKDPAFQAMLSSELAAGTELSYFNLQRYLKHQYTNVADAPVATA